MYMKYLKIKLYVIQHFFKSNTGWDKGVKVEK